MRIRSVIKDEQNYKILSVILSLMFILSAYFLGRESGKYISALSTGVDDGGKRTVVIDAGHGGDDPGKVGINGSNEKDVNLDIALYLEEYLRAQDVNVIMTRTDDSGLYDSDSSNKKIQDMRRRVEIIEDNSPLLVVSVHQNSYPDESVIGPQVFYYRGSTESMKLAEIVQEELIEKSRTTKPRQVKDNDNYFLLKKTTCPIVIAECGFLSNYEEAEKLCHDDYQKQIAWGLCLGIMRYLNLDE